LSKKSWVVAFNTPLSEKISQRTLTGCKWKRLLELIEDVRARARRQMDRPVEVMLCYEAGYDGFWLHRQLEAHGVRNYVIDPASLQVDRRARRVKTDRMDPERLLRSLMAYLRGEPKVWSVVRVPSVAEEDAPRLHRERDRLVSERDGAYGGGASAAAGDAGNWFTTSLTYLFLGNPPSDRYVPILFRPGTSRSIRLRMRCISHPAGTTPWMGAHRLLTKVAHIFLY
jgi:hypothetical protein